MISDDNLNNGINHTNQSCICSQLQDLTTITDNILFLSSSASHHNLHFLYLEVTIQLSLNAAFCNLQLLSAGFQ